MEKNKKTKEELIVELAKANEKIQHLGFRDELIRKEFAKAFGWLERKGFMMINGQDSEPKKVSWEQIFVEIGKLLALRDFRDYEGNISELECTVEDIKKKMELKVENE